jgi:hypothetical protein
MPPSVFEDTRLDDYLIRATSALGRAMRVTPVTAVWREVHDADQVLGLRQVTEQAVTAGYLTPDQAERWLEVLAAPPFLAPVTLFVVTAAAGVQPAPVR